MTFIPHPNHTLLGVVFAAIALTAVVLPTSHLRAADPEPAVTVLKGDGDYVVFLHGFSVFGESLSTLARRIHPAGFECIDITYPSKSTTPESVIADHLRPAVAAHCTDPNRKIHFVGYSMGTVFVHRYLEESPPKNLGRVVLLATPYRGIPLIDFAKEKLPRLAKPFGPAANSMGTDQHSFPLSLGTADYSPGVIMGRRSAFPFFSAFIPGPDDGIVPVDGGKIPGASDFIVIDCSHVTMQKSKAAAQLVTDFLVNGRFDHTKKYRPYRPRPKITGSKRRHF